MNKDKKEYDNKIKKIVTLSGVLILAFCFILIYPLLTYKQVSYKDFITINNLKEEKVLSTQKYCNFNFKGEIIEGLNCNQISETEYHVKFCGMPALYCKVDVSKVPIANNNKNDCYKHEEFKVNLIDYFLLKAINPLTVKVDSIPDCFPE